MGVEKLDNSVYLIRGLYDLADMARSKHDGSTYAWASNLARRLHQRFEGTWWMPEVPQHADSIDEFRSADRTTSSRTSTGSA